MTIKTRLGATRYNNRMGIIWETARRLEQERLARAEEPNPNLTDVPKPLTDTDRALAIVDRHLGAESDMERDRR
jgi:hypothetical protein